MTTAMALGITLKQREFIPLSLHVNRGPCRAAAPAELVLRVARLACAQPRHSQACMPPFGESMEMQSQFSILRAAKRRSDAWDA